MSKVGQRCIWGDIDSVRDYGGGIEFVITPSHGGFILSEQANKFVPDAWKQMTFGLEGLNGFYEEDQDWVYPILTFPARFDFMALEMAFNSFMSTIRLVRRRDGR